MPHVGGHIFTWEEERDEKCVQKSIWCIKNGLEECERASRGLCTKIHSCLDEVWYHQ